MHDVHYLVAGGYAAEDYLAHLKRNKRASGRPQDIADLANLA